MAMAVVGELGNGDNGSNSRSRSRSPLQLLTADTADTFRRRAKRSLNDKSASIESTFVPRIQAPVAQFGFGCDLPQRQREQGYFVIHSFHDHVANKLQDALPAQFRDTYSANMKEIIKVPWAAHYAGCDIYFSALKVERTCRVITVPRFLVRSSIC